MCPGVPVSDCAIIWPRVSKTPQARSCDSRTTVLKAVRISAACCSLATERSRFQSTSSVTGSRLVAVIWFSCTCDVLAVMRSLDLHSEVALIIDRDRGTGANDGRRFALLDDGGAGERRAWSQPVAVVDRDVGHPATFGHVGPARAFARGHGIAGRLWCSRETEIGSRTGGNHPPGDRFHRHRRTKPAVEAEVFGLERLAQGGDAGRGERSGGRGTRTS